MAHDDDPRAAGTRGGFQQADGEETEGERRIYVGLGSNLGDRATHLRNALTALRPFVRVTGISSLYETTPMHVVDQPDFYNAICAGLTALTPLDLLRALKWIEGALGRTPGPRFGPRVVDLDLLLYDDLTLQTDDLILPHPRLHERAFVLVPLAELAPNLVLPGGDAVAALLGHVSTAGVRRIGPLLREVD